MDGAEINKNVLVDCRIIGDAREVLRQLLPMVQPAKHEEWIEEIEGLKAKYPLTYNPQGLTGPAVIEELYRQTKEMPLSLQR